AVAIDDPTWASSCTSADRCASEVRARTQAEEVVLVRLYGGPLKIHVTADRLTSTSTGADRGRTREANVPKTRANWTDGLEALAGELFDRSADPSDVAVAKPAPRQAVETKLSIVRAVPWILCGVGVAAAGAGLAFGLDSAHTRNRIEAEILTAPDYQDLKS